MFVTRFTDYVRVKFTHGEWSRLTDADRKYLTTWQYKSYDDFSHHVCTFLFAGWNKVRWLFDRRDPKSIYARQRTKAK